MNTTDKNLEKYIKAFETHYNGENKQAFHKIRKSAIQRAGLLGFPNTKQEEWRFTNPSQIAKSNFKIADKSCLKSVSARDIEPFLIKDWQGSRIVFIDGFFSDSLSYIKNMPGVSISSLSHDLEKNGDVVSRISSIAPFEDEVFIALNTAFTSDGSVINIAENTIIENNIHILHLSFSAATVSTNRNMIALGKNAQATVIESFHSLNDKGGFVNTVTEISVDENAKLNHYRFQDESINHFHVGTTAILQKANSMLTSLALDFGGRLVRNNISTILDGEGITSILNGLYLAEGEQHIDNHTFIDHARPHCESHELYRGILNDRAKGVFSGKIMVRRDAQKTDAKQSNNCLLLSDAAQIDAKPQLEIYADDVKCTHGATIGQLDDQAIEYMRSRGIPYKKAIQMLTYAFAEEIIISIEDDAFRARVESRLLESLSK